MKIEKKPSSSQSTQKNDENKSTAGRDASKSQENQAHKTDGFQSDQVQTSRKLQRSFLSGESDKASSPPSGVPDAAAMMRTRGTGLAEHSPMMMEATSLRSDNEPTASGAYARPSIPMPDIPGIETASMSVAAFTGGLPVETLQSGKAPGYWDPRLSDPNQNPPVMATFEAAQTEPGEHYLHADSVRYESDQESDGRHHIYVKAPEGVNAYAIDARGEKIPLNEKYEDLDRDGKPERYFEMPMWGGNEYKVGVEGQPGTAYEGMQSDSVMGLKMPANHHVNYHIDFTSVQAPGRSVPTTNAPTRSMPSVGLLDTIAYEPPAPAAPSTTTTENDLAHIVQENGLRTNQDLINHFYGAGGGTWDGAIAAAEPYGVDMKKLAANRGASIDVGPTATQDPADPNQTSLETMVQQAYRDILQREADPTGLQHWKNMSQDLRDMGKTDAQIQAFLQEQFTQSGEYKARFGDAPPTTPSTTPGIPASSPSPRTQDGQLINAQGQVENFIGANYTDLGHDAIQDPTSPAFRDAVAHDLARLKEQGVDTVRVWAAPPNTYPDDDTTRMSQRIDVIAQEAAKQGMNITVDLTDSFGNKSVQDYQHGDIGRQLDQRIPNVVGPNAHHPNIDWSVGNEIGDPSDPMGFANWYTEQTQRIREQAGPGQRIICELTPGAVGHPDHGWDQAREAMQKIVQASDVVGVHFYPVGAPGQLSGPRPDGTWPAADWDSVQSWASLAKEAGKPFVIGEFSIPRDAEPLSKEAYIQQTNAWLQELHSLGADQVRFWQFMKDEVGHFDPAAVDLIDHAQGHKADTQSLLDALQQNGWIGKKPLP
ncbi:MAG: hypothetical protein H6727_13660 [Myxococcales bacterium]|nr:hypothetical protein [Myxococcales bacterium]